MRQSPPARMFKLIFRYLLHALVAGSISCAHAGPYEDFFAAIQRDHPANLTALLERGFDPNTPDPQGRSSFGLALRADATRAAQVLIDHPGFDVNGSNASGESALMLAAIKARSPSAGA